ncbi:peptide chain release factor N(5)-glutamine methyltransferase [soil metagenome]
MTGKRTGSTWRELLAETAARVGERPAARWLCEVASGADRLDEVLNEPVTQRMVAHLDAMLARYEVGEPLAYVLGRWGFRHLDLMVDRRVLIPRPETEVVAGVAIELAGQERRDRAEVVVADIGTGSGAIGLAMAEELPLSGVTVWLTDDDRDALEVARANLAGIGRGAANVRVRGGRWFEALPADVRLDVAVANPPYIAEGSPEVEDSVRRWEPHHALFAGPDGLDAIRSLIADAPARVRPGGWLVLEIGADQGAAVRQLFNETGYSNVQICPDLAGRDRVAVARRGR